MDFIIDWVSVEGGFAFVFVAEVEFFVDSVDVVALFVS